MVDSTPQKTDLFLKRSDDEEKKDLPPKDHWNICYYIFFIVGFSFLFPWHIFIKNSFFLERFSSTPYATTFSNWIARSFMTTNLLAMIALMFLPEKIKGPSITRVSLSLFGNVFVFLAMTLLPLFEWIPATTYFYITLFCAGFCGLFAGVLQNSLCGMASGFPSKYIQGTIAGQGLAGLISSLIFMISNILQGDLVKTPHEIAIDAAFYFGLSLFFIIVGFLSFMYARQLEFFEYHTTHAVSSSIQARSSDESLHLSGKGGLFSIFSTLPSALYPPAVFFMLFITLSAFPYIFSNIVPSSTSQSFFFRKLFTPTGYLLYDLGDYIGKSIPALSFFYSSNHFMIISSSFSRLLFIPLFLLCNFRDHPDFNGALRLFTSPYIFFALALLFGLTNGYLCSLLFMNASQTVPSHLREKMGMIMPFFLSVGLALGPLFAGVYSLLLK